MQLENAGMRVIVTHSERNRLLRQKPERLAAWVNQGAYLQMTGQSLQGFVGSEAKKFAELLMEKGRVHFLASDAHDVQRRPPRLDQAWKLVSDKYGAGYVRRSSMVTKSRRGCWSRRKNGENGSGSSRTRALAALPGAETPVQQM